MKHLAILACLGVGLLAGCGDGVHTLYRSNVSDKNKREHVATFDAAEGEQYNAANCKLASNLLQEQPRNLIRFWCEKGPYKK